MIIFEGNEIVVHSNNHSGNTIVITFCPSGISEHAKTGFFAEIPLENLKVPAIGITALQDFWFLSEEEAEWLPLVQEIITKFEKVILIGCSMGAHAAIRLSEPLRADIVLAMSPKWSLDRSECEFIADRYVETNFRESMRGMGLRSASGSAKIFTLFDPNEEVDAYHARMISIHIDRIHEIKLFHVGHGIVDFISGTDNMLKILRECEVGNVGDIVQTISKIKRRHPNTLGLLIELFCEKKPLLLFFVIRKVFIEDNKSYISLFKKTKHLGRLNYFLKRKGCVEEARNIITMMEKQNLPSVFERTRLNQSGGSQFNLVSFHGYILAYNIEESCLCGDDIVFPKNFCLPVLVNLNDQDAYLKINFDGASYFVCSDGNSTILKKYLDKTVALRIAETRATKWFSQVNANKEDRGYVVAGQKGLGVMFEDGRVWLDCKTDHDFESFVLLPVPDVII